MKGRPQSVRRSLYQEFNAHAALAAILFILTRSACATTIHKACKLLYFAEKLHLERYGRQIVGDTYFALQHGPVPSEIYDAIKYADGRGHYLSLDKDLRDAFKRCIEVRHNYLRARCEPNLDDLSRSDVRCLEQVIADYGNASFEERTSQSHDAAYSQTKRNAEIPLENIVRTLPNSEILLEYLRDPYPDIDDRR